MIKTGLGNQILIASPGEMVDITARRALDEGCDRFVHNDRMFYVRIKFGLVGTLSLSAATTTEKDKWEN